VPKERRVGLQSAVRLVSLEDAPIRPRLSCPRNFGGFPTADKGTMERLGAVRNYPLVCAAGLSLARDMPGSGLVV
jgi:hypothetical protein